MLRSSAQSSEGSNKTRCIYLGNIPLHSINVGDKENKDTKSQQYIKDMLGSMKMMWLRHVKRARRHHLDCYFLDVKRKEESREEDQRTSGYLTGW